MRVKAGRSHMFIPDTQDSPGVPRDHLRWIGLYAADRRPDVMVHAGDHWTLDSLSRYNKPGSKTMEGKRFRLDVDSGNEAWELIDEPVRKLRKVWQPDKRRLLGNHENRITVALESDPKLEGAIGLRDLQTPGWRVHDFLEPVWIDGVCYSHYFYAPLTGRPYTGTIDNRLRQQGHSFSMGHQQTLMHGVRFVNGRAQHGLVAGACYLHDEEYKGPQGNAHWRGIIMKHQVEGGSYDPMFVSLNYLCLRYEGMPLAAFMKKKGYEGALAR